MKQLLQIVLITAVLSSCMPKFTPLKGNYSNTPFSITSDNSKDVVWDKIIDLFAQNGLPIKIIDRSSGLITSDRKAFLTTTETNTGSLVNKRAWLVVPGRYDKVSKKYYKATKGPDLFAEWNIRIKEAPGNKTLVNVNIVNIKDIYRDSKGFPFELDYMGAKSTGVFEKLIADIIK